MSKCNQNCDQGRTCQCAMQFKPTPEQEMKMARDAQNSSPWKNYGQQPMVEEEEESSAWSGLSEKTLNIICFISLLIAIVLVALMLAGRL